MYKRYLKNHSVITIFVITCLGITASAWAQTPISFDLGQIQNGAFNATITSNEDPQYTLTVSTTDNWIPGEGLEVRSGGGTDSLVVSPTLSSLEMQLVFSHDVILTSYHVQAGTSFPATTPTYDDNRLEFSQGGTQLGFISGADAHYRGAFGTTDGHTHLITDVINPGGTLHTTTIKAGTALVLKSLNPDTIGSVTWTTLSVIIPEPSSYALIICLGAAITTVVRKRVQRAKQ